MPSMVASSIAKAADDVGDAVAGGENDDGAPLPHERLPAMAAVAISPPRNIRSFCALKAVTSLPLGIILGRGAAVNYFRDTTSGTRRCEPKRLLDRSRRLRAGGIASHQSPSGE